MQRITALAVALTLTAAGGMASARAGEAPLIFGVVLPLSGPYAEHGQSALIGMKARVREINATGGVHLRPLELRVVDNESELAASATATTQLAADPDVLLVLGPVTSGAFAVMGEEARRRGIVVLSPVATQDGITRGNRWMFRVIFDNGFEGAGMARFLVDRRGFKRLAVFADRRHGYAVSLANHFLRAAAEAGAEIVADLDLGPDADSDRPDYRRALRRLADAKPDAVFIPAYGEEVQAVVRQAGEVGLDAVLCGGDSWDLDTVFLGSGKRLAGSYFVASFDLNEDTPRVTHFVQAMQEAGLERADGNAAPGYDAVTVAAMAVQRCGPAPTRESIRQALYTIQDVDLVTGKLSITADGDARKSLHIMEVVAQPDGTFGSRAVHRVDP